MYAIIRTGGKQYKVRAGDVLKIEKLEKQLGDEVELVDILAIGGDESIVGQPTVENAKVTVVITKQSKAPKVIVFKKKRRQGYRRMKGHRQIFTEVFVKSITTPDGKTVNADTEARVFDPDKKAEKQEQKAEEKTSGTPLTKKAVVKKAAKKKTKVKKKTKAKKKTAKKAVGKKKTKAKKKTKKS